MAVLHARSELRSEAGVKLAAVSWKKWRAPEVATAPRTETSRWRPLSGSFTFRTNKPARRWNRWFGHAAGRSDWRSRPVLEVHWLVQNELWQLCTPRKVYSIPIWQIRWVSVRSGLWNAYSRVAILNRGSEVLTAFPLTSLTLDALCSPIDSFKIG